MDPQGAYVIFGPSIVTVQELNVPTPAGKLQIPVRYFRTGKDIFYVSSQPRVIAGDDAVLLSQQADGIQQKFKVGEFTRESFTRGALSGLRMYIKRPDSFKIVELIATPQRTYQIVTDLASETAPRLESLVFRLSFSPMETAK